MSTTTPPGWYPDPGTPTHERWWDGRAWTGHTRPAGGPQAPATAPMPLAGSPGQGGGIGKGALVALVTAGAVLVAAIVTGVGVRGGGRKKQVPRSGGGR
ncbi:DUF2510 domain-containing protein, partial [Streptomyces wuyuanensis]|uniref:DUF2510 domain-containing protein n=1 Tax=Streptomyces wuyuanensis TaxID=1196353 RepID=UPI00381AAFAB